MPSPDQARVALGSLRVHPLCLGGNSFGWTANEETSFRILDHYVGAGGNFIDTADAYSYWVPGNVGGESEEVLGAWLRRRGRRDDVVIATKAGMRPGHQGLRPQNLVACLEGSLARLGVDHVDLFYVHLDDESVPQEEYLEVLDDLVRQGKIRELGASNFEAARLASAVRIVQENALTGFAVVQERYNLVQREPFETGMAPMLTELGIGCVPYRGLANGFLTGKYREGAETGGSRSAGVAALRTSAGYGVLAVLDEVAARHGVAVGAVALSWLAGRPSVATPLAGVSDAAQLDDLLDFVAVRLSAEECAALESASNRISAGAGTAS